MIQLAVSFPAGTTTVAGVEETAAFPDKTVTVTVVSLATMRPKVTVAVVVVPPVMESGLKLTKVGVFTKTVSEVVLVTPLAAAETCTTVLVETLAVTSVKVALLDPAGTVTAAGIELTAELPLVTVRVTEMSAAATAMRFTVPVVLAPPMTEFGENEKELRVFVVTVREAVFATPFAVADT